MPVFVWTQKDHLPRPPSKNRVHGRLLQGQIASKVKQLPRLNLEAAKRGPRALLRAPGYSCCPPRAGQRAAGAVDQRKKQRSALSCTRAAARPAAHFSPLPREAWKLGVRHFIQKCRKCIFFLQMQFLYLKNPRFGSIQYTINALHSQMCFCFATKNGIQN